MQTECKTENGVEDDTEPREQTGSERNDKTEPDQEGDKGGAQ